MAKILMFVKDRSHEKFPSFNKILISPQTSKNDSEQQKNTSDHHLETRNSIFIFDMRRLLEWP